jgi:hypothetical protein
MRVGEQIYRGFNALRHALVLASLTILPFDFLSFLKISVSLSARQAKLLGQSFGSFGQCVTLCQQVECGIQPVGFVGV